MPRIPTTRPRALPMMQRVRSSTIHAIGYDAGDGDLFVQFHSDTGRRGAPGMTYRFTNVPEALWMRLQGASSKGKFFARNIKGRFHYARWTGATWRGQGALKNDSAKRKLARLRAKVRGRS